VKLRDTIFFMRAKNRARVERASVLKLPKISWERVGSVALSIATAIGLLLLAGFALNRPVRHVELTGTFQRVSALEVEQIISQQLTGGFLTANLDRLQKEIGKLHWVDHVRVQRRWPASLVVQVTEQVAVARWGESGLLNARGELFLKDERHVPPELPHLDGPEGSEHQVSVLMGQLQSRLNDAGLRVTALRLDARGAWEFDLENGMTVRLGRRQVEERIERFIKVGAPVVASRLSEILYLDMRYSNGFSVGWRTQGVQQPHPTTLNESLINQKRDQDV
jgi:cell division protein FtsQ